jgi:tRNA nucleotidyltransferase (CCA-adding enzyme)
MPPTPVNFKDASCYAYKVGGCIRDSILGLPIQDIDYVMECADYTFKRVFPTAKRVGNDFPVYLVDGNEVALTRSEKSTGPGYKDFGWRGATLIEDLHRRDFTINAIAESVYDGRIIDPTGGVKDIENKTIRAIGTTAFADDPLRIFRAARFAAKLDFVIEEKTYDKMKEYGPQIVHVNAERVEKELRKVYEQCAKPSKFFDILAAADCLHYHFAPLDLLRKVPAGPIEHHGYDTAYGHTMKAIDRCKTLKYSFDVFLAVLCHDFGKGHTPSEEWPAHHGHEARSKDLAVNWFKDHRFSARSMQLSLLVAEYHMKAQNMLDIRAGKLVRFFRSIREPIREDFFSACNCDHAFETAHWKTVKDLHQSLSTAVIVIPEHIKGKDKCYIQDWVNQRYTSVYMVVRGK